MDDAQRHVSASAGRRFPLIADSFARLTGRSLLGGGDTSADAFWSAPIVVLAHGSGPDPAFFYGNRLALELFEVAAQQLVGMPSRLSAESGDRSARDRLLDRVRRRGFIDDYAGVRISATGRRFRIERATVWNLVDGAGVTHGQGAAFAEWTRLD